MPEVNGEWEDEWPNPWGWALSNLAFAVIFFSQVAIFIWRPNWWNTGGAVSVMLLWVWMIRSHRQMMKHTADYNRAMYEITASMQRFRKRAQQYQKRREN